MSLGEMDIASQLQTLQDEWLQNHEPMNFDYYEALSYEHQSEKAFVDLCFTLQEYTSQVVEDMTVFKFFSLFEYVKKKNKPKDK